MSSGSGMINSWFNLLINTSTYFFQVKYIRHTFKLRTIAMFITVKSNCSYRTCKYVWENVIVRYDKLEDYVQR